MTDNSTITIWVGVISASSAIIGVVATQVITAFNNRKTEIRRQEFEILKLSLERKIEIGEHFYSLSGENLNLAKTLISNNELLSTLKSDNSREYISSIYTSFREQYQNFKAEKNIYSSVEIYYNISSTYSQVADNAQILKTYIAKVFEYNQQLSEAKTDEEKFAIVPKAREALQGYQSHLQLMVESIETDMKLLKMRY